MPRLALSLLLSLAACSAELPDTDTAAELVELDTAAEADTATDTAAELDTAEDTAEDTAIPWPRTDATGEACADAPPIPEEADPAECVCVYLAAGWQWWCGQ